MLFYQSYARMGLAPLNDVNYKIICFCCFTKRTFIDSNAQVANNICKECIKYFSDILAARNCIIFFSKCYFITITRTFIWQKIVYSFLKFYIASDVFNVQNQRNFIFLSKRTYTVIPLFFTRSLFRLSFIFQKKLLCNLQRVVTVF